MNIQHKSRRLIALSLVLSGLIPAVLAQGPRFPTTPKGAVPAAETTEGLNLKFSSTPLEIVLQDYSEKTGKTLLRAPGLPSPVFTLRSQGSLTLEEYLFAIETEFSMHGIGLVAAV
jgi:hypothetical protein